MEIPNNSNSKVYFYYPEEPFTDNINNYHSELKRRISNNSCCIKNQYDIYEKENIPSSAFSSSPQSSCVTTPVSSSCDEYEDSDTEFHAAEISRKKIKRKILARDRDNTIDYLLKRRSLVLQRQSSNASTKSCSIKSVRFADDENNFLQIPPSSSSTGRRNLSRTNSSSSTTSSNFSSYSNSSNSNNCDNFLFLLDNSCSPPSNPISYSSNMNTKMNYYQSVTKLAKQLRSNCDKILDMSVPFVIDSSLLCLISDAINEVLSNNPNGEDNIDEEFLSEDDAKSTTTTGSSRIVLITGDKRNNYEHDCMFITDFFEQTPSLCIVLSEHTNFSTLVPGTIDITLFRSLQFLELRKIPIHMVAGINTIRVNLKKLKCTRCVTSLSEIFVFNGEQHALVSPTPSTSSSIGGGGGGGGNQHHHHQELRQQMSTNSSQHHGGVQFLLPHQIEQQHPTFSPALSALTSVWPELREIDFSYNHIEFIDTKILELIPSVEILNLSRNRISSLDSSFTRVLNCLTVLNLNYNQLTAIPPLPPNLKILLLSNNYISHLTTQLLGSNLKTLEILDVSQNVISDEQQLEAFHQLSSLISLAVIGNPISYSDSYRTTVASHLNRSVLINKQFILDKKKLSNSEIRYAMEAIKKRRPPLIPTGTSCFMTASTTFDTTPSRFNDIKSLTQSYDSNSSSIRSACRKKAKIREVVVFDDSDDENIENMDRRNVTKKVSSSSRHIRDARSSSPLIRRVPLDKTTEEQCSSKSLDAKSLEEKLSSSVHETKIAIESLREKYGPENWLQRQGGCEVKKLLGISDKPNLRLSSGDESELFSKSLPQHSSTNTSFYSAVTNWEATSSFDDSRPNKNYPAGQGHVSSITNTNADGYNSSSASTLAEAEQTNSHSSSQYHFGNISGESIKCMENNITNNSIASDSNAVYYSCTAIDDSITDTKLSLLQPSSSSSNSKYEDDNNSSVIIDDFVNTQQQPFKEDSPKFRFFQNGQIMNLVIDKPYLYEVDPNVSNRHQFPNIITKWDLNSLKSLSQEKNSNETGTIEFRLHFDTFKKHMKERSFNMTKDDFKSFESLVEKYLKQNTIQEFIGGFQCIKCNSEFTKPLITVKIINKIPKEVSVCTTCGSDLLIPLEHTPLPNNENLEDTLTSTKSNESPKDNNRRFDWSLPFMIKSSTPVSGHRQSETPQSVPTNSFFGDLFKFPNITSSTTRDGHKLLKRTSSITSSSTSPSQSQSQAAADFLNVKSNNNIICFETNNNADEVVPKNTKSDSDVEVLSCDSSSIEVLTRNDDISDVEAEEAVEIFVPDATCQLGKLSTVPGTVVMTESNSSGSFAESVCTTYEKVLGTNTSTSSSTSLQISQQLNQTPYLSPATTISTNNASSVATLFAKSQNQTGGAIMGIKYDYQDFTKIDHRLQLFCEISVFKKDEELLALTKALVLCSSGSYLCLIIFSTKKIYFYKITGPETEKPESWLSKKECYPLNKLQRLDVLIGRHSVGMDFQGGKYYALVFRDSKRTSNFFEYFLCDICSKIESPIVQDLSQIQKTIICSTKTISYFGMLRLALCESKEVESKKMYQISAVVLTEDDLQIFTDFSWMIGRNENVTAKHTRSLKQVRQVECLEGDATFVQIVFQLEDNNHVNWELCFETQEERDEFANSLQQQVKNVPFISLSQPLEP